MTQTQQKAIDERLHKVAQTLYKSSGPLSDGRIDALLTRYLHELAHAPEMGPYQFDSPELQAIRAQLQPSEQDGFQRRLFLALLQKAWTQLKAKNFPAAVVDLYIRDYCRLLDQIDDSATFPGISDDGYQKDLAILLFRMFPLGCQKAHLKRIALKPLCRHGLWQFLRMGSILLWKTKGISPFLHLHTCSHDIQSYLEITSSQQWIEMYRRAAELCIWNPKIRGVTGSSWFFDPALESISPRLYHIIVKPLPFPVKVFYAHIANEITTHDATDLDPQRKRLYQTGKYVPKVYTLLITRNDLLRWYHQKETKNHG